MSTFKRQRVLSLSAVAVGATVLGVVLAGGLGLTPHTAAREATPIAAVAPCTAQTGYPNFADLAERVNPSVVSVYTEEVVKPQQMPGFHGNMDPFEFFFGPGFPHPNMERPEKRAGAGSGFFVSSDGLILTNNHVVEGADKVWVRIAEGSDRVPAKVVGRDPATDIALIKIDAKKPYPPLPLGDSSVLRVGDWVMAVGNPLAMEHTVTVGVVSAKNRTLNLSDMTRSFEDFIQTDAAINLGNSGGPLVNLCGQVVGMNTAINAAGQNLGFAIPVNTIKSVLPQLETKGKVIRGYLGVTVTNLDQRAQEAFKLPSRNGALVESVSRPGPADKAGVKAGDVIVAVDGVPVKETRELIDHVSAIAPGRTVELDVIRDGSHKMLSVVLGERPDTDNGQGASPVTDNTPSSKLGIKVDNLSDRARRQFQIPQEVQGVIVTKVSDSSPADEAGLNSGDVIMRVDAHDVTTPQEFTDALSSLKSGTMVRLYVYRPQAEQKSFVFLRLP